MAIEHFTASSNNSLKEKLAEEFSTGKLPVFRPVYVITPNKAQHDWLKGGLAAELGIVGNLKQHSLNSFLSWLEKELREETSVEKIGNEQLIWRLFANLGSKEFKQKFNSTADYCGEDEIKRLALAQKLAGLFENYSSHRPELVIKWDAVGAENTEDWQTYLFLKSGFGEQFNKEQDFFKMLRSQEYREILKKKVGRLYIFGSLDLSPVQLDFLKVLGKNIDITIYRTEVNFDQANNPLLESWGQQSKIQADEYSKLEMPKSVNSEEKISSGNFLNKIQQDILKNKIPIQIEIAEDDKSLLVYNSFTKIREVEALYNYLVKLVNGQRDLGASDMLVVMPGLDNYIAAIKTVFDAAPHKFPYTLVSRGYAREEGFWTALEKILAFEEENFTAPAVFDLLEMQPIRDCFGFVDLDLLFKAFGDANIRREYKGNPDFETNFSSFRHGLKRLVYGFCLGSEEPVEIDGIKIYPVDIAEGQQAQDFFRLHYFVEQLNDLLDKKKGGQTPKEWHKILMEIAKGFLKPEEKHQWQLSVLLEKIGAQGEEDEEMIAFNTFFFRLKDQLLKKEIQQLNGKGGIVFSGLYSGMSMPKKVVAFLGMNFEEFPRKSQRLSFDKLLEEPKLTDPNPRREDRAAFMEVFLNAGQQVLLSYIGQNVKDNSEIPPSAIISELKDYGEKVGVSLPEVKHPLHAYNSAYFDKEKPELFTYLVDPKEKIELNKSEKNIISIPESISLYQLESFLKDPFRHYYQKVLGIYYENQASLKDTEVFELDNLQNWGIKDDLLKNRFENNELSIKEFRLKKVQLGDLPLKTIGEMNLEESNEKINLLWEKLKEIKNGRELKLEKFSVEFDLSSGRKMTLNCKLDMIGESQGLFLSVSKEKRKYKLVAYLRYLALIASGKQGCLYYLCLNDSEDEAVCREIQTDMSSGEAQMILKSYLKQFINNYTEIIPFYPEFDFEISKVEECIDDENREASEKVLSLIKGKFNAYQGFYPSEFIKEEYRKGYFEDESRLLYFKELYIDIFSKVEAAFNTINQEA